MAQEPTDPRYGPPTLAVTAEGARAFAAQFGLPPVILARCSTLFCLELYSYHYAHDINPSVIVDEVLALEGIEQQQRETKKLERFRHDALRGLWKKHYFSARFLPMNLKLAWEGGALEKIIWAALDPAAAPEGEDRAQYAHRLTTAITGKAVHATFLERQRARKVTGEWIVYAPHTTGNHYVCLATHREGDDVIREKIVRMCLGEFPFLRAVLRVEDSR